MMASVTLAFSADTDKDADIIAWWEGLENRSATMREAIRAHRATAGLSLADVMNELDAIKRLLRSGVIVQQGDGTNETDSEPVDPQMQKVKAALSTLGNGLGC